MPLASAQVILSDASSPLDPHVSSPTSLPRRVISLNPSNNWSIDVGRATTSHIGPVQAVNNARFGSKVMSRDHAVISAEPGARRLYVTDMGSMHGTHIHGRRLQDNVRQLIAEGDTITFGAVVDRGDSELNKSFLVHSSLQDQAKFNPIVVQVSTNWLQLSDSSRPSQDLEVGAHPTRFSPEFELSSGNPHFASDHSNEEKIDAAFFESDSEIDCGPRSDFVDPPRRFTVPESDLSEDDYSDYSNEEKNLDRESVDESPSSSPYDAHEHKHIEELANDAKAATISKIYSLGPIPEGPQPVEEASKSTKLRITDLLEDKAEVMSKEQADDKVDYGHGENPSSDEAIAGSSRLQVPPFGIHHRDPSPSDAALARTEVSKGSYLAFEACPPPPSDAIRSEPQSQRSDYAWAGYNQVLYEAPPPLPVMAAGYPSYTPLNYAPPVQYFQPWHHDQTPFVPGFSLDIDNSHVSTGCKRKANDMNDDVEDIRDREPTTVEDSSGHTDIQSQDAQLHTDSLPSVSDMSDEPIVILDDATGRAPPTASEEGPARKKQKRNKDDAKSRGTSRRKTFVKYAATAVASAALGAVGAVLGLAALPQDYFV